MILGIESSCDESALALYDREKGLEGEWVHSQIAKHAEYGGVVPDLAVRQHLQNFFPLLDLASKGKDLSQLVTEIAVTCGPGLIGCLGVGLSLGKTLGSLWGVKVVGVNHLRAHAFSTFMNIADKGLKFHELLPHLGLLVSGGNTLLFEISENAAFQVIGRTRDDAAGEALDKGAKLLGIPYPGGAELERRAKHGNPMAFSFPRAFQSKNANDFSFSGLKTSLLYTLQKMTPAETGQRHADLCASYQEAAIDQLVKKSVSFLENKRYRSFGLSGGVANNQILRNRMKEVCLQNKIIFLAAEKKHSGDNAAMIAHAATLDSDGLWSNNDGDLNFKPGLTIETTVS
jgi:N6-L-threonylcarbamoyladenine synthase